MPAEILARVGELVQCLVGSHLDALRQQVLAEGELPAEDRGPVRVGVHHVGQVAVGLGDVQLRPTPEPTFLPDAEAEVLESLAELHREGSLSGPPQRTIERTSSSSPTSANWSCSAWRARAIEPRALPRLDRNSSAPFEIIVPAFENLFSTIASIASRSVPTSASAACTSAASPNRSTRAYRNMMIGSALEYGTMTTPRMNASVWARDST